MKQGKSTKGPFSQSHVWPTASLMWKCAGNKVLLIRHLHHFIATKKRGNLLASLAVGPPHGGAARVK